jgi:hypothetical protein
MRPSLLVWLILLGGIAGLIWTIPWPPSSLTRAAAPLTTATATGTAVPAVPTRGVPGDLWADVIIGKPDYAAVSPYTTVPNKLFWAHGTIVDRSSTPNKLYVYDSGNNRILGLDLGRCLARPGNPLGCTADLVLGQPIASTSACNGDSGFQHWPFRAPARADSLCGQPENVLSTAEGGSGASMAVGPAGNLYVTDFWNHRVLKYIQPFTTDSVADEVWGQPDFTQNTCNRGAAHPDATTLCFGWGNSNNWTAGVDIDPAGNLWVTDSGNNRLLRYAPGDHTANLVLGQSTMLTGDRGAGLSQLDAPAAVRMDSRGWTYVADQGNNRVLVFAPPFTNGMAGRLFGAGFAGPAGIDFDPGQPGVWIANQQHHTLDRWDEDSGAILETLGDPTNYNVLDDASGSVGIDAAGNKFIVPGRGDYKNDVLMWARGAAAGVPTKQLFGDSPGRGTYDGNLVTASGIASGGGVAVVDNQLIVADLGRVLFWNNPLALGNGQAASGVTGGVVTFTTRADGCCLTLQADHSHHLWVSFAQAADPDRLAVYGLPLATGSAPLRTIQLPLPVLGGGQIAFAPGEHHFWGVAPSADSSVLWVSQSSDSRVFRIRNPLTNPVVDVILGQTAPSGILCNRGGDPITGATPDSLCWPGSLALDRFGNLYVSDHSLEIRGNMRLLEFDSSLFPTNNTGPIYAPAASKIFPSIATWEPAFDSRNQMVVGYNPYWTAGSGIRAPYPRFYDNPLFGGLGAALQGNLFGMGTFAHGAPSSPEDVYGNFPGVYTQPLGPGTAPDATVRDYYSQAIAATFDDYDNLYLGDGDRARVLIYRNPLGNPTPAPATQTAIAETWPTATPTPLPGCIFADVCPGAYFYTPVQFLVAHEVISGYGDNTFRPYNNTTRGQMVKIVALGFSIPIATPAAGGYTFADVPPSFPFFTYIESGAAANIVGGYGCGGRGEPCDAARRPYFRPGADVTRGQLSKIVVGGAGFPLTNPASATFADVPPGSAFYPFVETAMAHGLITGYACGAPGEPCNPPANPRYFRPATGATRGQIAKIVYSAIVGGLARSGGATPGAR